MKMNQESKGEGRRRKNDLLAVASIHRAGLASARQRLGLRQSSAAFEMNNARPKAAEDCRSPRPRGVAKRSRFCCCSPPSTLDPRRAFTLIEIMVVVGILAIIMSIAIPSVYQQMQKEGMRAAVSDVLEACGHARARAVLDGTVCELTIRVPPNGGINVTATGRASSGADFSQEDAGERSASGGGVFSAKFSNQIIKVDARVFEAADRQAENEVVCKFYPNGTCDAMWVELVSDRNEIRIITTDVVTGIADVEVVK